MITTVPIKTKDFRLGINFNFAKNETILEKLDGKAPLYKIDDNNQVVGIPGKKLGLIRGTKYNRNDNGQLIVDDKGLQTVDSDQNQILGNIQADWTGSINLNAEYKGFYLSVLTSIQEGGDIYSSSERSAVSAGTAERTTKNDRMALFVDGVTVDGGANNVMISAEEYWRQLSKVDEEFIYDASFMKLKELAIGYNFPKSLLNKIPNNLVKSVRLSLVGRNLFYFYKHTPGTAPDASAFSSALSAQAYDFSPVPATRTYGFSLNVGF